MTLGQLNILALGANLPSWAGPPETTLTRALEMMPGVRINVCAVSPFYRTPCFPAGAGPDYVNAAALVDYAGDAQGLLDALHGIEADLGRTREKRWGTRAIDIDLIAVGDAVLPDSETQTAWRNLPADEQLIRTPDTLILPHPRLQDRAFVLVPLCDIAPQWVHPLLGLSARDMLARLDNTQISQVVRL